MAATGTERLEVVNHKVSARTGTTAAPRAWPTRVRAEPATVSRRGRAIAASAPRPLE